MKVTFKRLAVAFSVGFSLLSPPVFAEVYNLTGNLTNTNNPSIPGFGTTTGTPASGAFNITFTTGAMDIPDNDGALVTAISGTFLGANITGLSATYQANHASPPDNRLYDGLPSYFSGLGISFLLDSSIGTYNNGTNDFPLNAINFNYDGFSTLAYVGCGKCDHILAEIYAPSNLNFTQVTQTAQVPEPETYAMFMAGLGLLSFASRKKKIA